MSRRYARPAARLTFSVRHADKARMGRAKRAADRAPAGSAGEDHTRERILKTAEQLFAKRGFDGVSVRELASAAQVNVASIAYHFESKEGLLAEVYRRHCEPLIEERLRGLAAASRLAGKARLSAIIEAFVRPALQQVDVEDGETFIRLRAVLSGENSELLEKLVAENFDQSSTAFIDALCGCLPHLTRTGICWRFHFLLGSIYYTAAGPHRIYAFSHGRCDPADTEAVIKELVPFMTRAFEAPASKPARRAPKTG